MTRPPDWIVPDWPAPPHVRSMITTRNGGVSTSAYASCNLGLGTADDPAAVRANRELLRAQLPQEPRWLRQVHGSTVVAADQLAAVAEADASVARKAGTVCVVMIADCMPILLCDRAGTVVGIAHAGWRGMSSGVIENAVHATGAAPVELLAYLGPAIGPDAYEVGAEVRAAFLAADAAAGAAFRPRSEGKWLADLYRLARQRLARCGVTQVYGGGWCTHGDRVRFYSHRRDRITGRMAALIWLARRL